MEVCTKVTTHLQATMLIQKLKYIRIYACISGSKPRGYEVLVNSGDLEKAKKAIV